MPQKKCTNLFLLDELLVMSLLGAHQGLQLDRLWGQCPHSLNNMYRLSRSALKLGSCLTLLSRPTSVHSGGGGRGRGTGSVTTSLGLILLAGGEDLGDTGDTGGKLGVAVSKCSKCSNATLHMRSAYKRIPPSVSLRWT